MPGRSKNIMLSAMMCCGVFNFQKVLYNQFLTYLGLFRFNFYI